MTDRDSRPKRLTLKDLMRLCFNAGRGDGTEHASGMGWDWWWKEYGEDRHDDYEHWRTYGESRHEED